MHETTQLYTYDIFNLLQNKIYYQYSPQVNNKFRTAIMVFSILDP